MSLGCVYEWAATIRGNNWGDGIDEDKCVSRYPIPSNSGLEMGEEAAKNPGSKKSAKRRGHFARFRFSQIQ